MILIEHQLAVKPFQSGFSFVKMSVTVNSGTIELHLETLTKTGAASRPSANLPAAEACRQGQVVAPGCVLSEGGELLMCLGCMVDEVTFDLCSWV